MVIPTNCQFEITESCNHGCEHCYNAFGHDPLSDNFDTERIAKRIAENNIFYVTITGGEPFMVRDRMLKTASVFGENNMDFSVNTNLTLTKPEDIEELKEKGLVSILTSIASHNPALHDKITGSDGSFNRLMQGIKNTRKADIHLAANMVINRLNKDQVYATGRFIHDSFDDVSFCATPMVPSPGKSFDHLTISSEEYINGLDELLRLQEDFGMRVDSLCPPIPCLFENPDKYALFLKRACLGGRTTFTISSGGQTRPCSHSAERYGNILDENIRDILPKMTYWRDSSLIPEECDDCGYESSCRGGCRVAALAFTDTLKGVHPYFKKPVTTQPKEETQPINLNMGRLEVTDGKIRYREEERGLKTIYINQNASATMTDQQFRLFNVLRTYNGKRFDEIEKDLEINSEFLSKSVGMFIKRKLMKLSA